MHLEDVYVDSVEQHDRVSLLRGRFRLGGEEYAFGGIAFMGYGGPNVSVSLEDEEGRRLIAAGLREEELERLLVELQRRLIDGDYRVMSEEGSP